MLKKRKPRNLLTGGTGLEDLISSCHSWVTLWAWEMYGGFLTWPIAMVEVTSNSCYMLLLIILPISYSCHLSLLHKYFSLIKSYTILSKWCWSVRQQASRAPVVGILMIDKVDILTKSRWCWSMEWADLLVSRSLVVGTLTMDKGGILTIFSYKIQVMLECGAIMADLLASGSPVVGTLVMDRGGYYEDYLWMSTIWRNNNRWNNI